MIKDPFARRERKAERERKAFFDAFMNADRRTFLKLSGQAATLALAGSAVSPHSFQLVEFLRAAEANAEPQVSFRFAYVSDTHLFNKGMTHRFVKAAQKAVNDANALNPQPDFILFGGDLAQLGQPDELKLGKDILSELKAPVRMMVGEHDWFFDMGEKWQEFFGKPTYSFDYKAIHFITLQSVHEKDFWTARKMTPMERMQTVAGLDNGTQSRFEVGEEQRKWLAEDLAKVSKDTPIVVFSHSPLYKYYRDWNFWTDDAEQVQELLFPFQKVTVIHGHTHQLLTNRIRNIAFHGMLSTAWPWPYAPTGLPKITIQMDRADPFDQFDGCGDGTVEVRKDGEVNKNYNLWSRNPFKVTYEMVSSGQPAKPGPSY
jgi:3',5'-cyclic AMP phosphodiesterase CpdA